MENFKSHGHCLLPCIKKKGSNASSIGPADINKYTNPVHKLHLSNLAGNLWMARNHGVHTDQTNHHKFLLQILSSKSNTTSNLTLVRTTMIQGYICLLVNL